VTDRREVRAHDACGRNVDRVLLALDGRADARVRGDVALRHEPPHAHGLPGRERVIGALGPQAVGQLQVTIGMAHVHRLRNRGQLMNDRIRPRPDHRLRDLIGIKRVRDHRHRAQLVEYRPLGLATRHPMNLMTRRHQTRHQQLTNRSRRTCHKHSHHWLL
jgi:hypothetical protein